MYKVINKYANKEYTLHDPRSEELQIYDDEVITEDNEPGSFTFTMSPTHPYIDTVLGMLSEIVVYDDDEEIFRGRPISEHEDINGGRVFTCEGELAFLFDTIQPRRELHDISPLEFFTLLVNEHNRQVSGAGAGFINKTFEVGIVTVTDPNDSLYRYTNRETTLDCIREKIIDRLGGHLRVRVQDGHRYLDLLSSMDVVADQPLQLGENLLDYSADTDYTEIATACIPLGEHLDESEIEALDAYLTIEEVNDGKDYVQLPLPVSRYGFICKTVHFDSYTTASALKAAGEAWLQDGQYATLNLELTAIDLHVLGYDVQPIRACRRVHVLSEPHGMNRFFTVLERTYHLTRPDQDRVVFGSTITKRSYTSHNSSHFELAAERLNNQIIHNQNATNARFDEELENVSNMLNQATHGYVVLDPCDGPERILVMETNSVSSAQKIWKWDMNGFGYSSNGINGPWGVAITMDGHICADFLYGGTIRGVNMNIANGVFTVNGATGEVTASNMHITGGDIEMTSAENASKITLTANTSTASAPKWTQLFPTALLMNYNDALLNASANAVQVDETLNGKTTMAGLFKQGIIQLVAYNNASGLGSVNPGTLDILNSDTHLEAKYAVDGMTVTDHQGRAVVASLTVGQLGGQLKVCDDSNPTEDYAVINTSGVILTDGGSPTVQLMRATGNINTSGDIFATGDVTAQSFINYSSRTVKRDIRDMDGVMDKIRALRPVSFHYNKDGKDAPLRYGLIAEEAQEVAPEIVGKTGDGVPGIDYGKLVPYLLRAVQELDKKLEKIAVPEK